jgi:hypothetical protein
MTLIYAPIECPYMYNIMQLDGRLGGGKAGLDFIEAILLR